jgi:hypothetical protein
MCLVQFIVFSVCLYEVETWIFRKNGCKKLEMWCWKRTTRTPWTARRSIASILVEPHGSSIMSLAHCPVLSPHCSEVAEEEKDRPDQGNHHTFRRRDSPNGSLPLEIKRSRRTDPQWNNIIRGSHRSTMRIPTKEYIVHMYVCITRLRFTLLSNDKHRKTIN